MSSDLRDHSCEVIKDESDKEKRKRKRRRKIEELISWVLPLASSLNLSQPKANSVFSVMSK